MIKQQEEVLTPFSLPGNSTQDSLIREIEINSDLIQMEFQERQKRRRLEKTASKFVDRRMIPPTSNVGNRLISSRQDFQ